MTNITKAELLEVIRKEATLMFHQLTLEQQQTHKQYLEQIQQATTTHQVRLTRTEVYRLFKANDPEYEVSSALQNKFMG